MSNMAQNGYKDIANEIIAEDQAAQKEETVEVPISLFRQMEEMMASEGLFDGRENASTDGEIGGTVLRALQETGGDATKIPSAMGAEDFGDEEGVAAMVETLQQMSPEEQAKYLNDYMGHAQTGEESILKILNGFSQEEPKQ